MRLDEEMPWRSGRYHGEMCKFPGLNYAHRPMDGLRLRRAMFMEDNTLPLKIPQVENRGNEVEDTVVQPVSQEGGATDFASPHGVAEPGVAPDSIEESSPADAKAGEEPSSLLPNHRLRNSPEDEDLGLKLLDPGTFKVIQGRQKSAPNAKKVQEMCAAIKRNQDALPPPIVFEDADTGERFCGDGGHRQAAHANLGIQIRVHVFRVKNAKARAELEACRANTGNGLSASSVDRRFQLKKACELFHNDHHRYPKPSELAALTEATHETCASFLRGFWAPKTTAATPSSAEEQKRVIDKLEKVRAGMASINLSDGWIAGDAVKDALAKISAEVKRIAVSTAPEPEIKPQQIEDFQKKHNLTLEKLGELLGVNHGTVSRWLRGKTKMTEHHKRAVRQLLALTTEQVDTIIEGGGTNE